MYDALRIIMERHPELVDEAARCLRALHTGSPMMAQRYTRLATQALAGDALTAEERQVVAGYLDGGGDAKSVTVQVRMTPQQKLRLQDAAAAAGQDVSTYVRHRLGLE